MTSIGDVRAGVHAGIEQLDTGIAAAASVERALEEAPALIQQAQEQVTELIATLGRLGQLEGINGAAVIAAVNFREGGMRISKAMHGAGNTENKEASAAAYALWQDKRLRSVRGFGSLIQAEVNSANQQASNIAYHLGEMATRLRGGAEETKELRETAQGVRDKVQERCDGM